MPLQTQLVTLPFVKGVETKLDPKLVDNGSLLALENASYAQSGSLTRRDAWEELPGSDVEDDPRGVCTYGAELLTVAGETLYSYSPAGDEQAARGTVSPCSIARESVFSSKSFVDQTDAAYGSGYICYVWRDVSVSSSTATANGVKAVVVDAETKAVVFGPTILDSSTAAQGPKVVGVTASAPSDAAAFIVTWKHAVGTDDNLFSCAIDLEDFSVSATATVRTDARGLVDVLAWGGSSLVAYCSLNATDSVYAMMLAYSGGSVVVHSGPVSCALAADLLRSQVAGITLAAYSDAVVGVFALGATGVDQGVWAGTFNRTSTAITAGVTMSSKDAVAAPTAGLSSITATLAGDMMLVFSDDNANLGGGGAGGGTAPLRSVGININNTVVQSPATVITSMTLQTGPSGPYISGKAFTVGGRAYLPMYVGSMLQGAANLQNTWFLWSEEAGAIIGKALYGTFGFWTVNNNAPSMRGPPSSVALPDGTFLCPTPERGQLSFAGGNNVNVTPVGLSALTLDFDAPFSTAQVGQNQFFAGGMLAQYDGRGVTEAGFHLFPEYVRTQLTGTGLTGTYQYCALYEWTDNNGQRHQSAPTIPVTVTPANESVRVTVATLAMTAKTDVTIVIYRTLDEGQTFFRVNTVDVPIANSSTSAMTANYDDSATDASIEDNEILYTVGEELEHNGPGFCGAVAAHQDRLWLVGLEDPSEFRFSQEAATGQGLAFNEALSGRIPQGLGGLTAAGSLDDKAVLYTDTKKLVIFGAGPTPSGINGTYSAPQLLPSDVGCIDPRSVINAPNGQMYQSQRGLYLLTRALQDEYVGSPVEEFVIGSAVTGAVVLENLSQVRFTVIAPDGAIGACVGFPGLSLGQRSRVLVYDIQFQQWSSHSTEERSLFGGVCVWDGLCTYADINPTDTEAEGALGVVVGAPGLGLGRDTADSDVLVQDAPGSFLDFGATAIPVSLSTQWIRLGQLSGFERVRRLVLNGSYGSDSEITIGVALNYNDEILYTATLDSTGAMRSGDVFQLRHHIARQKCQAIKFTITDTPVGLPSSGQGCNFSGITLELGMKRGTAKLPAAATI